MIQPREKPTALPAGGEGDPRMPAFGTVLLENCPCGAEQEAQKCQEAKFKEKKKVPDALKYTE